ncbi:MAG TPA: hypothetical protein VJX23_01455 [Candidatus Binataceae bacterium]|nr:hypothetical protein [Candidatus Binataceae bacterium]
MQTNHRHRIASLCATVVWIAASASIASAHGGMAGPDELGRPLITSVILAAVCYWVVILWPSRKPDTKGRSNTGGSRNRRARPRRPSGVQGGTRAGAPYEARGWQKGRGE